MTRRSQRAMIALLLSVSLAAAADEVAVITLRHRTVDEVLPILRPLVDSDGALSGTGDSLIVRSSPENIEQLRQVLAAIDTAPKTLMISVRQDSGARAAIQGGASGLQRREQDDLLQQVRTLEGNAAHIAIGQSVPIPSGYTAVGPGGIVMQNTVTMQDYASGFTVVPRISGDRVTLEIGTAKDRPTGYGAGRTQGLATTVSGRLGDWIDLGGIGQTLSQNEGLSASGGTTTQRRTALIQVRVDEVR